MDPNEVPTKGNLVRARNSLKLSRQGYELMDKKRNILIRELTKIPLVRYAKEEGGKPAYSFYSTYESLDEAKKAFVRVKELTLELAQVEIAAYRLAAGVQKTRKRANALQNITIPYYEELAKSIQNSLEEKEREEFTRLKVIKRMKVK